MATIKLYANLISPPSRAVEWVMRLNHVPHELVVIECERPTFPSADFLALNPNGLLPVLEHGTMILFESHAILVYLAEAFGWTALYPRDVQAHAKVNEYLHWHHTNARLITTKVVVPLKRVKLNEELPDNVVLVNEAPTLIAKLAELMETFLLQEYLASQEDPTLADFAAYCEFVQLDLLGFFDFTPYPKVVAWMHRMKHVPLHDEMHAPVDKWLADLELKTLAKIKEESLTR
ncbi:hypothetical protein PsorP6_012016 [Peronosclerospora sorghi]|uniref:Uncharacterized protein n=1 Tax=Peronosclerospora sorghi TaxID=230839 RepID=A0ACC0WJG7_9STRA|nr:hypothetical protein PsorP6_012016 [Peronosclerospora sorghi]